MNELMIESKWLEDIQKAVEYVSLIDSNDLLLFVNHLQPSSESIVGRSVYDFVEPAFHELLRDSVVSARATGIPQHFNSYAVNADGERSFYSNWVISLNAKEMDGIVAFIATDITQQFRVEEKLQLSETTLKSVVENSPDTIFVVDRNRILLFASKLEYGFDSSQVLGLRADLFVPEDDLPAAIAAFEEVLESGKVTTYDATIMTPLGPRRFSVRLAPIMNRTVIDRVMLVATHVTESHEAELAQSPLREQLHHAQKMEAIGQLTGGVAHDFNNILLTISGNLELAQADSVNSDRSSVFIQDALDGVRRARDLIQRLLAFSRRQPLSPVAMDIGALVESIHTLLQRTLGENIRVRMDTSSARGRVSRVDRAQLENAILNLALNGRDAMPKGGVLVVSATWINEPDIPEKNAPFGYVRLSVTDTGIGMDEATVAQAIDPFFTTKQVGTGSGLGLSMVYGFVQQSGGFFRISSEQGSGTTVEIDLPCVDEPALPLADIDDGWSAPRGNGELILLVEDEPGVREVMATILERLGYRTLRAESGDAAMTLLGTRNDIELLITDVVMPGVIDGFELANRSRELNPELPIMLVSGHPLDTRVTRDTDQWLDVLLQKPYRTDELARFIRRVLST